LREAPLNALIHKGYASGNPIQIRVTKNSLWIWNEGPLPERSTAETLLQAHASHSANPDVAHTFYLSGHIEAWGRGYERIAEACREAKAPEPTVEYDGSGIWLKWARHTPEVTPEVMRMLAVVEGELGRREIQSKLGLHDEKHFREFYQQPAVTLGLIETTIPDKPNSRPQKCRLTAKGRAQLALLRRKS
jgi:ATP-dependent DNA helicase RecG